MRVIAALLLVLLSTGGLSADEPAPLEPIQLLSSVTGSCTAFSIGPGVWLTAAHCVHIDRAPVIAGQRAWGLAGDPVGDVAVLVGPEAGRHFNIASDVPPHGALVTMTGYAQGQKIHTIGTFIGRAEGDPRPANYFTLPARNGMSGGPILNASGEVVGVLRSRLILDPTVSTSAPLGVVQAFAEAYRRVEIDRPE